MRRSLYQLQAVGGLLTGAFVMLLAVAGPVLLVILGLLFVVAGWVPLLLILFAAGVQTVQIGMARLRRLW